MRKKISLMVLSNSGSSVRQLTISTTFMRIFALACFVALGIMAYDYYHLKVDSVRAVNNETRLSVQSDEIMRQRKQIQEFRTS